jgi:head-tail adaptor
MIGKLRERVRIERETRTPDGGGGFTVGWLTVAVRWAAVEPLKGLERLQAMQLEAANLYKVTLRNECPEITAANRLVWITGGGLALNIRDAAVTGRGEPFRVLIAEAGVAQ